MVSSLPIKRATRMNAVRPFIVVGCWALARLSKRDRSKEGRDRGNIMRRDRIWEGKGRERK